MYRIVRHAAHIAQRLMMVVAEEGMAHLAQIVFVSDALEVLLMA